MSSELGFVSAASFWELIESSQQGSMEDLDKHIDANQGLIAA